MDLWQKLKDHHRRVKDRPILDLFGEGRASAFSVRADGLLYDYSKTNIDDEARALLLALAEAKGVSARRAASVMSGNPKLAPDPDRRCVNRRRRAAPLSRPAR